MRFQDKYSKTFLILLILFFLILINHSPLKDQIRLKTQGLFKNIFETSHFFFYHLSGGIHKLGESIDIYKERDRLKLEVGDLRQQLLQSKDMEKENKRLKALLDFQSETSFQGKAALIIGRDILAPSDVITINEGKEVGVDVGTVLIHHDGLVGHVTASGEKHSTGLLITDIKARVCAMVQETRESGIIQGTETPLLKLKHLNINASVKIGDVVVTSGFGDIFPKGIPIGVVQMIGTESDNLYLYALVKPYVDFSKLEEVLCLDNGSNSL